jgi:hypothetical protein
MLSLLVNPKIRISELKKWDVFPYEMILTVSFVLGFGWEVLFPGAGVGFSIWKVRVAKMLYHSKYLNT